MTTLYQKQGRRYIPAKEEVVINSLQEGAHLVIVKPGLKTVTCNIDPDYASLIAAAKDAEDAMCAAIQKAMSLEPNRPITKRQREILDQFIAAGGAPVFSRKSAMAIVNAGLAALIKAAGKQWKEKTGAGNGNENI